MNKAIATIDGELIDKCVIVDNDDKVQGYAMKKNEILVDVYIYNFVKPKWNGSEWVENATEEEMKEAYLVIEQQPTQEDILSKEVANIKIDNMKKDLVITNALQTIASLKVEIMGLKGGNV